MSRFLVLLSILLGFVFSTSAHAQITGGVFPPGFGPDHKSAQYRIAVDFDNGDWVNRLHYQQSVNEDVLWRVVGQTRDTGATDFDFDFLQAEVFWRFKNTDDFQSGLRFDARLRDEGRSEQLGLNWMNQWQLNDGWRTRFVALSALQVGENSSDDIRLEVRGQVAKRLDNGWQLGGEIYSPLGDTGDLRFMKDTSVSAGPFVAVPLGGKRSVFMGPLFGLTDAARDAEFRLWLTQGF